MNVYTRALRHAARHLWCAAAMLLWVGCVKIPKAEDLIWEDMSEAASEMGSGDRPDADMGPVEQEMSAPAGPQNVRAQVVSQGIEVTWEPVAGAQRYELQIDNAGWQNVGTQTTYIDTEAPEPTPPTEAILANASVVASDATIREHVEVRVEGLDLAAGAPRTYAVRAVLPDGITQASAPITERLPPVDVTFAWERAAAPESDGADFMWEPQTPDDPVDPVYLDTSAPADGTPRFYRVSMTTESVQTPVTLDPDRGQRRAVVQISGGWGHTCALLNDQRVRCWGANDYGQLGNNATTALPGATPSPVDLFFDTADDGKAPALEQVAAGYEHSCARTASQVYCWGRNVDGRLGDGTTTDSARPVRVDFGDEVSWAIRDIAVGDTFSCALVEQDQKDPQVYCWGANNRGQLGDGTDVPSSAPVKVKDLDQPTAISAGWGHACAISDGERVKCWGLNDNGQLGTGTTGVSSSPVLSSGVTQAQDISCGVFHTCAATSSGIICWGKNDARQVRDTQDQVVPTPTLIPDTESAQEVVTGSAHSCARLEDNVVCWGRNDRGQLGDGTTSEMPEFLVAADLLSGVPRSITAGNAHTCAHLDDGSMRCWGFNDYGQLGDGTTASAPRPVRVNVFE